MRQFTALSLVAAVFCASTASAEEHEFRLGSTFGGLSLQADKYRMTNFDFAFTPEYEWREMLVLTGILRLTDSKIGMLQPGGMPFDAQLSLPWQFSIGMGARFRVFRHEYVDLSLYGEFELPLGQNEASIDSVALKGETAMLFPNAGETVRKHVTITHLWRRLAVGGTVRGHFWRFRPYIDLGFISNESRIMVSFDQEAMDLLDQAKISPERFYDNGQSTFFYAVGTDFEIWNGIRLGISTTALPINGGFFFTGHVGLVVPIDLPTTWQ
jgi:hypothetical protein